MMTHEQMMQFQKYQKGTTESRALALAVAQFISGQYDLTPQETPNGFLDYKKNGILIETIHSRRRSLTVKVSGHPERYDEFAGPHVRVRSNLNPYYAILYVTHRGGLKKVLDAVRVAVKMSRPPGRHGSAL